MTTKKEQATETSTKTAEPVKFKGKYTATTGKRKTAVARVRLYKKGSGLMMVNGQKFSEYFSVDCAGIAKQSLKLAGLSKDVDCSVVVSGGGKNGQAEAIRHGIAKALIEENAELRPTMKAKGFTTRDARIKERKKPGLKKARKAPQWSKR